MMRLTAAAVLCGIAISLSSCCQVVIGPVYTDGSLSPTATPQTEIPSSAAPSTAETTQTAETTLPVETTLPTETSRPTEQTTVPPEPAPDGEIWYANCKQYVSLRAKASTNSKRLAKIPAGTAFTIVGWSGKFARVWYQGQEGYVHSNYVKPTEEYETTQQLSVVKPTDVYTCDQLLMDTAVLAAQYPDVLTVETLGKSELGRDIPVLRLGNPDAEYHVLFQGAIHGREHLTAWLLMAMVDYWLQQGIPGEGEICYHVIPMVNPDGVTISQTGKLTQAQLAIYYRDVELGYTNLSVKNYARLWKANGAGVDLNRNFSSGWEKLEGHEEPSSELYRGREPFCAAETKLLQEYTLRYSFNATVSYHSSGSILYWQYGNKKEVNRGSESLARAIGTVTGYPLAGSKGVDGAGYKDWAMDEWKIPSVTVEIGTTTPLDISREIDGIFIRNLQVFPAIAQWLQ